MNFKKITSILKSIRRAWLDFWIGLYEAIHKDATLESRKQELETEIQRLKKLRGSL